MNVVRTVLGWVTPLVILGGGIALFLLMGSQPQGHIRQVLDLPFERPRSPDDPVVRALTARLDSFLEHEALVAEHAA
jgi:hypothetical protein